MATNRMFVNNATQCGDFYKIWMVPVSEMRLDERYQRVGRTYDKLKANWQTSKCRPLEVNYREDEDLFYIIDGGHRYEVAKELGITDLPCLIHVNLTLKEEAEVFATQDQYKKDLTSYDKFKAGLCHEDPSALALKEMFDRHRIRVLKQAHNGKGAMRCLGTVWKMMREGKAENLEWIFSVISMAGWHYQKSAYGKAQVLALDAIYNGFHKESNAQALVAGIMRYHSPEDMLMVSRASCPQCSENYSAMSEYITTELLHKLNNKYIVPVEKVTELLSAAK